MSNPKKDNTNKKTEEKKDGGEGLIKSENTTKKLKTIGWVFVGIIITFFVYSLVSSVVTSIKEAISPKTSFPSVPTISIGSDTTAYYIGPPGTRCYLSLNDTAWVYVRFPQQGRKNLKPTGAYLGWAYKDWKEPRVAYPGMENEPWLDKNGLFPLEWKFKSVKGTMSLLVEVEKN